MSSKVQKTTLIGSIISAILASVCCLGPIVFAVLGISGAGFILKFEQYRPLFIGVAAALLGTGFYLTYKKKPAEQCEPGSHCANPNSGRLNKIILWVATVLVALFVFFPQIILIFSSAFAAEMPVKQENSIERDYLVKGMTCDGCVFGVKKALSRAGLSKDQIIDVDYKKPDPENKIGHAKVKFSKNQYQGKETDCKIVKEIKENPGYIAYWDQANTNPCGLAD